MLNVTVKSKICNKCNQELEIGKFRKHKGTKDGFEYYCKACERQKKRIWDADFYSKNKDIINKNSRENYHLVKENKNTQRRENYKTSEKFRQDSKLQRLRYLSTLEGRYMKWKNEAKKRRKEFNLTIDDLRELPLICFYSGKELTFESNKFNTISLDRIDSNIGYIKQNVTFCCSIVNSMKSVLSHKEFLNWVECIYKYNLKE